jgi:hypothetical protein
MALSAKQKAARSKFAAAAKNKRGKVGQKAATAPLPGLTSILRAACSYGVEPVPSGLLGLILPDGYDKSAGVAQSAGVSRAVGFSGRVDGGLGVR